MTSVEASSPPSPLALQLAARVEKSTPPTVTAICAATALATVALLDDERSQPGGQWHEAVAAWNGARIRKIVRRGRATGWLKAQEPEGVTVSRDGAEVRAFVPGPLDQAPKAVAKLQIQSSDLERPGAVDRLDPDLGDPTLVIAVTPLVAMSWGKQAAQCAHAAQRAWMQASADLVTAWDEADRPIAVVHPTEALWRQLGEQATVRIKDGGFTEIPAGTNTAVALWVGQQAQHADQPADGAGDERASATAAAGASSAKPGRWRRLFRSGATR